MRELLALLGAGAGTYAMRSVFILRSEVELPVIAVQGLKYVGPAVLSALVTVSVASGKGIFGVFTLSPEAVGLVVCVLVAWWKKNLVLTVGVGLAVVWILTEIMA